MRIIFFTQDDPFYVKIFFDEFFSHYKSLDEIKAIVISKPMGKKSFFDLAKQMYSFYGLVDFVRVGSKFVFYKLMSRRKLTKPKSATIPRTYSVKQTAQLYGIEVIEHTDLNSDDFLSLIKQYEADLFISVASPIIFKKDLINMPNLDCINIHNAPLPKYRGMLPNFWQLYHGEKEAGITIHRINDGIDAGDIVEQRFVPIEETDSLDNLIVKTKHLGAHLMLEAIEKLRKGIVSSREMPKGGSYFRFPTRKDVNELKMRGYRIF